MTSSRIPTIVLYIGPSAYRALGYSYQLYLLIRNTIPSLTSVILMLNIGDITSTISYTSSSSSIIPISYI